MLVSQNGDYFRHIRRKFDIVTKITKTETEKAFRMLFNSPKLSFNRKAIGLSYIKLNSPYA